MSKKEKISLARHVELVNTLLAAGKSQEYIEQHINPKGLTIDEESGRVVEVSYRTCPGILEDE